jgi:uncharacterized membrane protein YphA (DoxX/SURF4 family)
VVVALIGRALAWVLNVVANPPVPRRFDAHLRRFVLLVVVLAALCLAPLYLSPHAARIAAAVLVGVVLITALIAATAFRRLLDRFVRGDTLVMFSGRVHLTVPTLGARFGPSRAWRRSCGAPASPCRRCCSSAAGR